MRRVMLLTLMALLSSIIVTGQTNSERALANEIEVLTASINADPYIAQPYLERAKAVFKLNSMNPDQHLVDLQLEDALKDVNTALSLDCKEPDLYSLRAELKRDINLDYAGAVEDMNIALELDPDNPDYYLQRANYKSLSEGCIDYRSCAAHDDIRCKKIVKAACM